MNRNKYEYPISRWLECSRLEIVDDLKLNNKKSNAFISDKSNHVFFTCFKTNDKANYNGRCAMPCLLVILIGRLNIVLLKLS